MGLAVTYLTDTWHLDEVVTTIKGKQDYLWRAVDSEGNVLDVLMQQHRDTQAAKQFFRKLFKQQGFVPRVIVMDKLKSDEAGKPTDCSPLPRANAPTHSRLARDR